MRRTLTGGTVAAPRRCATTRASSVPVATDGSTSTSGGCGWRTRTRCGAMTFVVTDNAAGTPRATVRGTARRIRTRGCASATSTAVATPRAIASMTETTGGNTNASAATIEQRDTPRGVSASSRNRHRRDRSRDRVVGAVTLELGLRPQRDAGAAAPRARPRRRRRESRTRDPSSRAAAFAAASRCTAARGLAPSATLGSSRVRRTSATT